MDSEDKYQSVYTRESVNYDRERYECDYGNLQLRGIYHALDSFVHIGKDTRVLDVATGTGVVSLYLAQKGGRIEALDITEAMIEQARKKAESLRLDNISFRIGSALELPFENASFDVVTSNKFFHLIPQEMQKKVIGEMLRVLKPGGYLVVEFKNILYGGLLRIALKYLLRRQEGHCLLPIFPSRLFSGGKIVGMIGYYVPSQRRLPDWDALHRLIELGGHIQPFKLFYDKIYIKCEKIG